jgi:hypothetical protein
MSERFDEFSRTAAARQVPRRHLLRMAGVALAGATAATLLKPFKAEASCTFTCADGAAECGGFCCAKGESCSQTAGACCCPKRTTPCGEHCCSAGVACIDASQSICGCQAGTTPCGTGVSLTCCPAGTACTSGCPTPSGNFVGATCHSPSDVNLKSNIVPVRWA